MTQRYQVQGNTSHCRICRENGREELLRFSQSSSNFGICPECRAFHLRDSLYILVDQDLDSLLGSVQRNGRDNGLCTCDDCLEGYRQGLLEAQRQMDPDWSLEAYYFLEA